MKNSICFCLAALFTSCFFKHDEKITFPRDDFWKHDSTTHFKLHAQKGVCSEDSLLAIGQKLEDLQQQLLMILKEKEKLKLELYFLKDSETLTTYTGFPANGFTNTNKGVIYFVDKQPFHLALKHELMHALSWRLWGPPKGYWLSEGIAVFASGKCGGYSLHALAHAISKQNKIVPFNTLTDTFDFRSLEPSLQAASMVQFIYETYGVATLKTFWQKGFRDANFIIGSSATDIESAWKNFVDDEKFESTINWNIIMQSGCE